MGRGLRQGLALRLKVISNTYGYYSTRETKMSNGEQEMVMRAGALSVVVLIKVMRCPHCRRLRECRCLATSDGMGSLWRCFYCGGDFHLGKALTISLLSEKDVI